MDLFSANIFPLKLQAKGVLSELSELLFCSMHANIVYSHLWRSGADGLIFYQKC